eukprot:139481-Prymnesium_polylepis.4
MSAHSNAWRSMFNRGIPQAAIFENDVVFHKDFCKLLPQYVRELPCDPWVVYLGGTMRNLDQNFSSIPSGVVHLGGEGPEVVPWDTHAYFISHEAADLMVRRYDYSFLRMNITQLIPTPVIKADPGWDGVVTQFSKLPGKKASGVMMNAHFFMMHTYNYYSSSRMRKKWAWFDSTAAIPGQVGSNTFVKDPHYVVMPVFMVSMEKARPCFCGNQAEECFFQWTHINAHDNDEQRFGPRPFAFRCLRVR